MTSRFRSLQLPSLSLGLCAFVIVNVLVIDWALTAVPIAQDKLPAGHYARMYVDRNAMADSWAFMRLGLAQADSVNGERLYQRVFFDDKQKFQYPPTALLVLEALRRFPGGPYTDDDFLNNLSAIALAGTVFLVVCLLLWRWPGLDLGKGGDPFMTGVTPALAAMVLSLTFFPLMFAFSLGQLQTWIDLLFASLLLAWLAGRRGLAGWIAGLICLLKPTLALLFIWALLRRQWQFATGLALCVGIFGSVSLALYGLADHLDYLNVLSFLGRHGESYHANQSVNGLFHRLFSNGDSLNFTFDAFPPFHPWVFAATLVSTLGLVASALFWRASDGRRAQFADLLVASFSFTLAAPIVWEHHYGVALPIFAIALPLTLLPPLERLAAAPCCSWPLPTCS